jgi:hypothetical protein
MKKFFSYDTLLEDVNNDNLIDKFEDRIVVWYLDVQRRTGHEAFVALAGLCAALNDVAKFLMSSRETADFEILCSILSSTHAPGVAVADCANLLHQIREVRAPTAGRRVWFSGTGALHKVLSSTEAVVDPWVLVDRTKGWMADTCQKGKENDAGACLLFQNLAREVNVLKEEYGLPADIDVEMFEV